MVGRLIARVGFALALLAVRPAAAAPPMPSQAPPADAGENIDLADFGARFGLVAHWIEPGRQLVLENGPTRLEVTANQLDAVFDGRRVWMGSPPVCREHGLWIGATDAVKLFTPLLRLGHERPPPVRTIVIDPGHGGSDNGTENRALRLKEKTFTLDTAFRLQKILAAQGFRVVLTRTTDVYVPLALRPELARRIRADLFISIHFNSAGEKAPDVHGTETFRCTPRHQIPLRRGFRRPEDDDANPSNANDGWDTMLGYCIQRELTGRLGSFDRGLRHDQLAVLRLAPCPAVLIESGYLSNPDEARKIDTPAYRDRIAAAIAAGVRDYAGLAAPPAPSPAKK